MIFIELNPIKTMTSNKYNGINKLLKNLPKNTTVNFLQVGNNVYLRFDENKALCFRLKRLFQKQGIFKKVVMPTEINKIENKIKKLVA